MLHALDYTNSVRVHTYWRPEVDTTTPSIVGLELFTNIPKGKLTRMLDRASMAFLEKGDSLFHDAESVERLCIVISGRMKLQLTTPDTQNVLMSYLHPGDVFEIGDDLKAGDGVTKVMAATPCQVIYWPKTVWAGFVEGDTRLAANSMIALTRSLREANTRIHEMATQEVEQRLANAMLRLVQRAARLENKVYHFDMPILRQDLADLVGTTQHTVSRILSSWRQEGLVNPGRQRLSVTNLGALTLRAKQIRKGL